MALPLLLALVISQQPTTPPPGTPQTPLPNAPANPLSGPIGGQSVSVTPLQTTPQTAPPLVPPVGPYSFNAPYVVAESQRLMLTPKIDGKIDDEEWDLLTSTPDSKTYFQWEPGKIHVAATGPANKDLVVSLDLKGNGWLIGDDNLEVRVTNKDGRPVLSARQLDATNVAGPAWRELAGFVLASLVLAKVDATGSLYELTIIDPGIGLLPDSPGRKIGVRVDLVNGGEVPGDPFLPRQLAQVNLVETRAAALPTGLKWNVERNDRPVVPGESALIRVTFNGKDELNLKSLELRSEGYAKDVTNKLTVPFPTFDRKGRTFVDYSTGVTPAAEVGYRLLRATLVGADGVPAIMQASYRVAPPLDFDLVHETLVASDKDRGVKVAYYLRSNGTRRVDGNVAVQVPPGFRILNGGEVQKFSIADRWGRSRRTLELFIPANTRGTFPIQFSVNANGQKLTHTSFITIG